LWFCATAGSFPADEDVAFLRKEMMTEAKEKMRMSIIGRVRSCFPEKFGIPRQSGLVGSARATIELVPPFDREEMWRGLEQFSHIWVHFLFHQAVAAGWKNTVRPPRLGGRKRLGVFATRSPHRPNHLGLSVVRLLAVSCREGHCCLEVSGVDMLDGSPVIDIKPYLPYSDAIPQAHGGADGFGRGAADKLKVCFSQEAKCFCDNYRQETERDLQALIIEMLRHDPRPASQKGNKKEFGMSLWNVNIRWRIEDESGTAVIEHCETIDRIL
jgi:tRNA-Thr(GGU) m(6)t(6)A37 methyltransferase TsaA